MKTREELEQMIENAAIEYTSEIEDRIAHPNYSAIRVGLRYEKSEKQLSFTEGAKTMLPLIENLQRQNQVYQIALIKIRNDWRSFESTSGVAIEAITQADLIAKELEQK